MYPGYLRSLKASIFINENFRRGETPSLQYAFREAHPTRKLEAISVSFDHLYQKSEKHCRRTSHFDCLSRLEQAIKLFRSYAFTAKVLGGGSTFNGGAYQRGCAADYDRIEPETQCKGWGYKDVLRIFKQDENNQDEVRTFIFALLL